MVLDALGGMCETLHPGDAIPSHRHLMRELQASERSVLRAIEEMRRDGKIVRRHGSGTFVADPAHANGNGSQAHAAPGTPMPGQVANNTLVAIAKPDHSAFDRALELLLEQAELADLSLVCRPYNPGTSAPLPAERPVGYLLFRKVLLPLAEQLQAAGNRVVLIGAPGANESFGVANVRGDQEQGGYLATRHLIELGHRRIALCGDVDLQQTLRWRGHLRALAEAKRRRNLQINEECIRFTEVAEWSRQPERAAQFFRRPNAPTGVAVWNDHEAVKLLGVLMRAGIRVPEEVSLVGYDDLPEGRFIHPALTTLDTGVEQQLRAAINLLTAPEAPSLETTVVIVPHLIQRDSTGRAPA